MTPQKFALGIADEAQTFAAYEGRAGRFVRE
jgi:hypothetical protein